MGKISPFEILGETFSNTFRWIHLFLPIALVIAIGASVMNGYLTSALFTGEGTPVPAGEIPENFWSVWSFAMVVMVTMHVVQLSLFDAVMEQHSGWFSFGVMRGLRRVLPTIVGFVLFMLAYLAGIVLLVIPGLMVLFLLYMTMPLIVLDGVGPFAALRKSWQLTWGNAWRLVGAILLAFLPLVLVFWIVAFAFGIVPTEPSQPVAPFDVSNWKTWAWTAFTAVMGVFATTFYLVAFKALKAANASGGDAAAEPVMA